jgi:hypothetical protein
VGEQSEVTLDLLHQFEHSAFDMSAVDLGPRVVVIHGQVGFDLWRLVAFDVYTRTQFVLPSFTHATWEAPDVGPFTHPFCSIKVQHLRHRCHHGVPSWISPGP